MYRLLIICVLALPLPALGQTVVEMDLPSAVKILKINKLGKGAVILTKITNNYKQFSNVRVTSNWYEESIAALAKALRTDFDGSGSGYITDLTIWAVQGATGAQVFLAASMSDKNSVLLATDLDYMKGMIAYEILEGIRAGSLDVQKAQRHALSVGIEMQVSVSSDGEQTITFFGHKSKDDKIVGKLIVIEPPDLVWK
jgi:hypothetical protein